MTAYWQKIKAGDLLALLQANPGGLTRNRIMANLGIREVGDFHAVKGYLQDLLANSGSGLTLAGISDTALAGGWTYVIRDESEDPDVRAYGRRKAINIHGRLVRAYYAASSAGRMGLVPGTPEARHAERFIRDLHRLVEDSADRLTSIGVSTSPVPPLVIPPP